jgi:5-formyltetrahydrofolate cyclo-ligase
MNKSEIRKIYKQIRLSLSNDQVLSKSEIISKKLISFLEKNNSIFFEKKFAIYKACNNEVRCDLVEHYFIKRNIKFSYPRIVKKDYPLEFILYQTNQDFIANNSYQKIIEPKNGELIIPDILIVPLVAFDINLSRVGMGLGFYDRTINNIKNYHMKNRRLKKKLLPIIPTLLLILL